AATAGVLAGLLVLAAFRASLGSVFHVPSALSPFLLLFAAVALLGVWSTMGGFLLQAWGQERRVARLSLVTLLSATVYQLVAVCLWGLWGIVAAVAAAELTTILLFGLAVRREWELAT